jgi:hypothetical protein
MRTQSVPRSKHSQTRLYKNNLLRSRKAKVVVGCEIIQKTYTPCEHPVELLNVKPVGASSSKG